jgi:hypothetical protein
MKRSVTERKQETAEEITFYRHVAQYWHVVYGSVTNENGFGLDLLTPSFTISLNHNKLLKPTINHQPNPSSLTAVDSLHSRSCSMTDF